MSDEYSGYPGAPPGWYADPAGGPAQRWWDGYAWSEATILPSQLPPPPAWAVASQRLAAVNTSGLVASETTMARAARAAIAFFPVNFLVQLISLQFEASRLLTQGHQLRVRFDDQQAGRPVPQFSNTNTLEPVSVVLLLVFIAAAVIALMWQHRAASAARGLGIPPTHSPGWGVGSWFVPVAWFFVPYQAIRDCLPASDPNRKLVLQWWLLLVSTWTMSIATTTAALFSRGVAIGLSIPTALLAVALLAIAPKVVPAIGQAHLDLVGRPS